MHYNHILTQHRYLQAVADAYLKWFALTYPNKSAPDTQTLVQNLVLQDIREAHEAISEMLIRKIELTEEQAARSHDQPALEFIVEPTVVHEEDYANAYWFKIIAKDIDGVQHDYQITITFDDVVGYVYLDHPEVNPLFAQISPMAQFQHRLSQIGQEA